MSTNQTVCRLLIGNELRRAREQAGLKQDEPADHLGAKVSKISRLELGQTRVTVPEVKMLMEFYEADPTHTRGLLDLARGANQRGQWDGIRASLPNWFNTYVDLEAEAEEVRWIQAEVIPGLLQTEDYIRAIVADNLASNEDAGEIENHIVNRVQRRDVLHGEHPLSASFVLSESCLYREFGSPEVMRAQLHHLTELAQSRNIQIQVLPYRTKSPISGVSFGFSLLTVGAPGITSSLEIAYIETLADASFIDHKERVREYSGQWSRMTAAALGPSESVDFIREVAERT